uniref:Uncharacterized protein n=1 Tax=Lepeophtheirus salmonis TaxID=72036 RepID=A0A0K2UI43_LEPSM
MFIQNIHINVSTEKEEKEKKLNFWEFWIFEGASALSAHPLCSRHYN